MLQHPFKQSALRCNFPTKLTQNSFFECLYIEGRTDASSAASYLQACSWINELLHGTLKDHRFSSDVNLVDCIDFVGKLPLGVTTEGEIALVIPA